MHQISKPQNGTLDALILAFGYRIQYMTQQALNRRQFNNDIWKKKWSIASKINEKSFF